MGRHFEVMATLRRVAAILLISAHWRLPGEPGQLVRIAVGAPTIPAATDECPDGPAVLLPVVKLNGQPFKNAQFVMRVVTTKGDGDETPVYLGHNDNEGHPKVEENSDSNNGYVKLPCGTEVPVGLILYYAKKIGLAESQLTHEDPVVEVRVELQKVASQGNSQPNLFESVMKELNIPMEKSLAPLLAANHNHPLPTGLLFARNSSSSGGGKGDDSTITGGGGGDSGGNVGPLTSSQFDGIIAGGVFATFIVGGAIWYGYDKLTRTVKALKIKFGSSSAAPAEENEHHGNPIGLDNLSINPLPPTPPLAVLGDHGSLGEQHPDRPPPPYAP